VPFELNGAPFTAEPVAATLDDAGHPANRISMVHRSSLVLGGLTRIVLDR
jgi:hypothetical protein